MADSQRPFLLDFQAGVTRDGTPFDATRYLDALWCRWRLGRPRKMGGYVSVFDGLNGLPRKIHMFYSGPYVYIHIGTTSGLQQVVLDTNANFVSACDRTPMEFQGGTEVGWTLDAIFDTTSSTVQIVAHSVPDIAYVASATQTVPYIGDITSTIPVSRFSNPNVSTSGSVWTQPSVAGGIVCVQPFVFDFDESGLVQWSAPNLPLYLGITGGPSGAGQARISAQKIVAGSPLRGGGTQSPAALFWSLSEVITATYVGSPAWFAFNTISPSSSIIGTDCVIEYDGLYFWCGVDRFLVYNGTVSELPNTQNQDWFFSNLTPGFESQTYAFKIPRYGEIWWCAAMFGSPVPNYAVIYNLRENAWYDTLLPNQGRSAGFFAQGLKYPVMGGVTNSGDGYKLWLHENGLDEVDGTSRVAVRSYFETGFFGGPKNNPPVDPGQLFEFLEPDIIQSGDLSCYLVYGANARSPLVQGNTTPLLHVPQVPQQQLVPFLDKNTPKRIMRLHVESNAVGGNFICGRNIGHASPSDMRITS